MNIKANDPIGQLIQSLPALKTGQQNEKAVVQVPEKQNERFKGNDFDALRSGQMALSKGLNGSVVAEIQDAFLAMGFWTGGSFEEQENGVFGKPDGDFGPKMQSAVKNFQDNRGLAKTGQIDRATFAEIERLAPAKGSTVWSPSYAVNDKSFLPDNKLPNGERAKVMVDLSEKRLFLYGDDNKLQKVYSVAVGKINQATGKSITVAGYKQVDSMLKDPSWLGKDHYNNPDVYGPKLVGLGAYNPETGHVKNAPYELHGTNNQNSIGDNESSGCVRMHNEAIKEVYPEMKKGDRVYFRE